MPGYKVVTASMELVRRHYHITGYTIEGAAQSVLKNAHKLLVVKEVMETLQGPIVVTVERQNVLDVLHAQLADQLADHATTPAESASPAAR